MHRPDAPEFIPMVARTGLMHKQSSRICWGTFEKTCRPIVDSLTMDIHYTQRRGVGGMAGGKFGYHWIFR